MALFARASGDAEMIYSLRAAPEVCAQYARPWTARELRGPAFSSDRRAATRSRRWARPSRRTA